MKKKSLNLLILAAMMFVGTTTFALADNDSCKPGWAPFWSTSCTFTSEDQNGELVMYKTTCRHFIFTTKCFTEPLYDM